MFIKGSSSLNNSMKSKLDFFPQLKIKVPLTIDKSSGTKEFEIT